MEYAALLCTSLFASWRAATRWMGRAKLAVSTIALNLRMKCQHAFTMGCTSTTNIFIRLI